MQFKAYTFVQKILSNITFESRQIFPYGNERVVARRLWGIHALYRVKKLNTVTK
jgi:hypothetical protein